MAGTEASEIKRRKAKAAGIQPAPPAELARRQQEFFQKVARRAYELYEQRGAVHGYHHHDWLQAESELSRAQHSAWARGADGMRLYAEVPGVPPELVKVWGSDGWLLIEARHHPDAPTPRLGHRHLGRDTDLFLSLPSGVVMEAAVVQIEHGLLEVFLPFVPALTPVAAAPARKPAAARKAPPRAAAEKSAAPKSPAKSASPKAKKSTPAKPESKNKA